MAAYNRLDGADDAVNKLKDAMKEEGAKLVCRNYAIIKKPDDEKVQITEKGKIKKRHGAAVGALLGGASVILLGPVTVAAGALGGALAGVAAAAGARIGATYGAAVALQGTMLAHIIATTSGAVVGGYAAAKTETLDHDKLNKLGNVLQPNNSAIVAVFDQVVIPMNQLDDDMNATRDEVLYKVGEDIGKALQKGDDVAFMIAFTEDIDVVNTRTATGEDAADIRKLVIEGEVINEEDEGEPEETVKYEVINGKIVDDESKSNKQN